MRKRFACFSFRKSRIISAAVRIKKNSISGTNKNTEARTGVTNEFGGDQEMKKVYVALAFLSFLYAFGVIGAVERETISAGAGVLRVSIGLGYFWLLSDILNMLCPVRSARGKARRR